jgi:GT2 family glycosyltransferase
LISIIVLAHNQIEMTIRCLEAVCQSEVCHDWELLCVDNGSTESFDTLAKEFSARPIRFRLLRNSENLSFSRANNLAALAAGGSTLVFLNNDLIVSGKALSRLVEVLEREPQAGIVGSKLLFPDTGLVQHAGIAQMLWGYASNFGVGAASDNPAVQQMREMFAVTGALIAVDRSLFNQVGGFEEQYRYGYEDLDLCLKARCAGRRVLYVPEAVGYHAESSTLKNKPAAARGEANYRLFRKTWDPWLEPAENDYLRWLIRQGIRKVAIFGTGQAAQGLFRILSKNEIDVVAFTSTKVDGNGAQNCASPVVSLEALLQIDFDRLMVGSQYFFQVEPALARFDPQGTPLFPVLGWSAS